MNRICPTVKQSKMWPSIGCMQKIVSNANKQLTAWADAVFHLQLPKSSMPGYLGVSIVALISNRAIDPIIPDAEPCGAGLFRRGSGQPTQAAHPGNPSSRAL